jgi:23S rRNA (adenine-N6)-dimethyltransferase
MSSVKQRRVAYSQNFLHSRRLVATLVERSSIGENDVVIEIGPGKGIITEVLAERSRHVLTIEKDPHHAGIMCRRFEHWPNVTVFACDFLAFPLPETPFKVFANIPYRITTAIVAKLTSGVAPPVDTYLTVQREAAMKFAGIGGESMLSVSMKPWFAFSIEHEFQRRDFVPRPAVDSVLFRIAQRDDPALTRGDRERFRHLVEAVFSAWQPTIEQALRKLLPKPAMHEVHRQLGRSLGVRPSASTIEQWIALYQVLDGLDDDRVWAACASASARLHQQQTRIERPARTRARLR